MARALLRIPTVWLAALVLAVGCATTPPSPDYPGVESTAFEAHESTPLGKEIAGLATLHPGQSGFNLVAR